MNGKLHTSKRISKRYAAMGTGKHEQYGEWLRAPILKKSQYREDGNSRWGVHGDRAS